MHQGRIERLLMDKIAEWSMSSVTSKPMIEVERSVCPYELTLPHVGASALSDLPESRIIVKLKHSSEQEARPAQYSSVAPDGLFRSNVFQDSVDVEASEVSDEEVLDEVRCRFLIGTDGARSWTRASIGSQLVGESNNFFWGVVDGIPITDFPDIRKRCAIHSTQNGSIMVIPRENDLVRLYIMLSQPEKGKRPARDEVTPDKLLKVANLILAPYTIEMPQVVWYSCYEIGQRLATHWTWNDRVFIAGDACHTHSPKAGQGMNTSMADTFNLSWKLAHVLQKKADLKILSTYELERAHFARQLIQFDEKLAKLFSGRPMKNILDESGVSMEEFQKTLKTAGGFTSGTSVDYPGNVLVLKKRPQLPDDLYYHSHLARNLPVGRRLASRPVVGVADALSYHLGDLACADGRWKIIIFGGDVSQYPKCRHRLENLCKFLVDDATSPIAKYTPKASNLDSVFNVLAVLASPRITMECANFPEVLRPKQAPIGFRAYKKIFADDESYTTPHGRVYEYFGIDPKTGCLAVIRPDQHVSHVTEISDHAGIAAFFDSFMLPAFDSKIDQQASLAEINN